MAGSGSNQNPEKDLSSISASPSESTPSTARRRVLIVEDNHADVYLIEKAIAATKVPVEFQVVRDGQAAIQFFDQAEADPALPCPDLVILDINLPKKQGGEVLKHMRARSRCSRAYVIVVSTSDSERDKEIMKELGANGYFRKPSQFDEFMKLGEIVKGVLTRD